MVKIKLRRRVINNLEYFLRATALFLIVINSMIFSYDVGKHTADPWEFLAEILIVGSSVYYLFNTTTPVFRTHELTVDGTEEEVK